MPLSVVLAVFAIVRNLCNLTGGARLLQRFGVEAEEGGRQLLQRLEFPGRDVRLLVLGKAVDEEAVSADLEQDDRLGSALILLQGVFSTAYLRDLLSRHGHF